MVITLASVDSVHTMHVHLEFERGDATFHQLDRVLRELATDLASPVRERLDPDLDIHHACALAGLGDAGRTFGLGLRDTRQGTASDWGPLLLAYAVEVVGGISVEAAVALWNHCLERYLHRRLGSTATGRVIRCEIVAPEDTDVIIDVRVSVHREGATSAEPMRINLGDAETDINLGDAETGIDRAH